MPGALRELSIIACLTGIGMAFSLISGLAPRPWQPAELQAGQIELADARVLDVLWIDARSEAAYRQAHIPGAIHLNEDNWPQAIFSLVEAWLDRPRPLVVYCGSAECNASQQLAERLRAALPEAEVYSLKGGWDAWHK